MSFINAFLWPFERTIEVVQDHRETLEACDNVTGRAVAKWAKLMCLPQFIVAPILACVGYPISGLFFAARMSAMIVVGELDKRIKYTRALGLCHLVTFGPLFYYMVKEDMWGWQTTTTDSSSSPYLGRLNAGFIWFEMRVTALCLYMDTRDLILHLLGHKYPCYIREAVLAKKLEIKDIKASESVNWWRRLVGP